MQTRLIAAAGFLLALCISATADAKTVPVRDYSVQVFDYRFGVVDWVSSDYPFTTRIYGGPIGEFESPIEARAVATIFVGGLFFFVVIGIASLTHKQFRRGEHSTEQTNGPQTNPIHP